MGLTLGKPGCGWRVAGVLNSPMCTEVMAAGLGESWGSGSCLAPPQPALLTSQEKQPPGAGTQAVGQRARVRFQAPGAGQGAHPLCPGFRVCKVELRWSRGAQRNRLYVSDVGHAGASSRVEPGDDAGGGRVPGCSGKEEPQDSPRRPRALACASVAPGGGLQGLG